MNITEFLLARIAEDEAEAQVAKAEFAHGGYGCYGPSRVLAECAAKRAIIAMYEQGDEAKGWDPEAYIASTVFDAMRALAAAYADHPDYQQEWATNAL
jgi:hypothetical protein